MIFRDGGSSTGEHDIELMATDRTREIRGSNESGGSSGTEAACRDDPGDKRYRSRVAAS
jgi:hypothetical protein